MYSRWFNGAVVLLWVATMTWLVTEKVLPALLTGEPPNYEKILDARRAELPVGWELRWNGRPVGWAVSRTRLLPDHSTNIFSRVHFDQLPLGDMTPRWMRGLSSLASQSGLNLTTDARTVLTIDPLGFLTRIESSISFESLRESITMEGVIRGSELEVAVHSRDFTYQDTVTIDTQALLGNALSPQTCLPGLRQGQTWTVEVCSPLFYPGRPLEVLEARVERRVQMLWDDELVSVWLVVYHGKSGFRLGKLASPQGRLWVRPDGVVLKQEVNLFGSMMTFVRMAEKAEADLMARYGLGAEPVEDSGL
jgi:hypothetical protein